ncbi:MSEP-CTERM sorting domain-containing protein [Bacteroides sp. 519]|uniref:MSEP-CTERM sorting domain-containing protein n=1 Tax=Bacteroides sp. 519 TaxID=2302937 RepID=UPI0013D33D54|nr:MSEP-CTERM sorting domain-containing protein [Bacteroides sp. 519]
MKNLFNPKWIVVLNTIPVCILFYIFYQEYSIIKTMLEEDNIFYWFVFSISLGALTLAGLSYAAVLVARKKDVSGIYAGISLALHVAWMYIYAFNINDIVPFTIPQWMFSGNIIIYACTFLMPTLAYNVLLLVSVLTKQPEKQPAWVSFAYMVMIPVVVYVFFVILLPMWELDFLSKQFVVIGFIICTLLFLFFLCRGIYIILSKKAKKWRKYELVWKIPIAFVLPLLGLWINNYFFSYGNGGVFGDFTNIWFYVLTIVNGLLVCAPNKADKTYRFTLYVLRCITFSYTVYFFFVFLPYLPLSIFAILLVGAGFLMLAPLLLFLIHTNGLYTDFGFLKRYHSQIKLIAVGALAFLVIPVIVTATFVYDRKVLHEALQYVYEPDYSVNYNLNKKSLHKTLNTVKEQKNNDSFLFVSHYIPYITSWYNWIVLDNLTISNNKLRDMNYIFFGEKTYYDETFLVKEDKKAKGDSNVEISNALSSSRYDSETQSWISTVDIEITNYNEWGEKEFATEFKMPDGCWISDYYLYVGDKKEPGILSEKKTAMWVYSQIRNENKDPGILHYNTGNRITFKVFPFARNEVRRTGIEFMHKEPFELQLDEYTLQLGNADNSNETTRVIEIADGSILYVPAAVKKNLDVTTRSPYFHFIFDASAGSDDCKERFIANAEQLANKLPVEAKVTLVDTYVQSYSWSSDWRQTYQNKLPQGGFFLDRALKQIMTESNTNNTFPVIIVFTNKIYNSVMDQNYSDFRFLYPESDFMYVVNAYDEMLPYSLVENTYSQACDSIRRFPPANSVLTYKTKQGKTVYLRNNNEPDIIITDVLKTGSMPQVAKNWETGLLMQGYHLSQLLHPETSRKGWRQLLEMGFASGIMNPLTSYMVVENEAQQAALKRKQDQVLRGEKTSDLDNGSETSRMSEPEFYILLFLLGIIMWVNRKRLSIYKYFKER